MRTGDLTPVITAGRQICGSLEAASRREWLVTDGLGGYAMGTVLGPAHPALPRAARRGHASHPSAGSLALASLDPVVVIGDERTGWRPTSGPTAPCRPPATGCCRASAARRHAPLALGPGRRGHRARAGHGPRPARGRHRPPRGADAPDRCGSSWRRCAPGGTSTVSASATGHPPSRSPPTASRSRAPTASRGPGFEPGGSWYRGVRAPGGGGPRAEPGRGPLVRRPLRRRAATG